MNYDVLQVVFWSITYLFIIIFSLIKKNIYMPILALVLNYSWETNALIFDLVNNGFGKYSFYVHIIWIALDTWILILTI